MNFLAHAFLAGPLAADRLGGLIGDFVKGPLPAGLPADVAAGVALHRRIDSYAETHAAFCRSRGRVSPLRRRYAGILVDLFYDHFLASRWARFADEALEDFSAAAYALMAAHDALLPPRLAGILPLMRQQDWLAAYREVDAVADALDRMGRHRLRRPNPLAGSVAELLADYAGYAADFESFLPDALAFAAEFRRRRTAL